MVMQPLDAAYSCEWHFCHFWLYTAVPCFALSLHKQLLGTSPPLGSFIISASEACKSFMDSARQYWGKSLAPCPVGVGHRI